MSLHGFEIIRQAHIDELNAEAILYRHIKSGAELLSLINDDENKVFGITFRTPPADSTGIAHIMEHSVLAGSRKYQVREPFVELLKGSLNTFLNAFTSSDWTAYPVASQNLQDFYNLVDVYLDAVFYPLITPHHLAQEGWHYELEKINDPLKYKGVVFNEMKGVYSSPDDVFGRFNQRSLFPDHVYGLDSGGDPNVIPNLTYAQFKEFHETFYHPSNARIYLYGDDDPEKRLAVLDEYLRDFDVIEVPSMIPLPEKTGKRRYFEESYPVDGDEDLDRKGMVQINWMLPEMTDSALVMGLSILSYALISIPASPLRKALIDSGLGEGITGSGLSTTLRVMTFSAGLKGIDATQAEAVEALILKTLADLAENGLEKEMVEAALNTIEFALRENNSGAFPRGLGLMLSSLRTWLHDGDPLVGLAYEGPLTAVKKAYTENPTYFQDLIGRYLLENEERTIVVMKPDTSLGKKREEAEKAQLKAARAEMSNADLQKIITKTEELKKLQETPDSPEALATIPMLTLDDLEKESKEIPTVTDTVAGQTILFHDLFTNGIVYLDIGFDLRVLPVELLPFVNLFGNALLKMGTESEDFVKLSQRIGRKTGGIGHNTFTSMSQQGANALTWFFLRGKATVAQTPDLFNILSDILLTVKLDDKERFRQLVLEAKAGKEAGLVARGHVVTRTRLSACFNLADWAGEQMSGLNYLFFLRQLEKEIEADWPGVLAKLEQVRRTLVRRNTLIGNVTVDADGYGQIQADLQQFLLTLPEESVSRFPDWNVTLTKRNEGLTIPAQVNYVGKAANLYPLGYQLHGSISVITKHLRMSWLWEKIRVQGGAYGAFCLFDQYSGVFNYLSYRDPNLLDTLAVYDGAATYLQNLSLSKEELTKAMIGTIGDVDSYQLPDAKGYTALMRHLLGVTPASRQQYRDEILSTSQGDFKGFAEVLSEVNVAGSVAVLGSADAIEKANAAQNGLFRVTKVL